MNKDKNEDLINQINRLLEWLHQSDGQHLGRPRWNTDVQYRQV